MCTERYSCSVISWHVRREKYQTDSQPLICFIQSYKNIFRIPMKLFIKDFNNGFSNHMASSNLDSEPHWYWFRSSNKNMSYMSEKWEQEQDWEEHLLNVGLTYLINYLLSLGVIITCSMSRRNISLPDICKILEILELLLPLKVK